MRMTIPDHRRLPSVLILALGVAACTGDKGETGPPGTSCTVTDNLDGTKTIACEDGTTVTISDGASARDRGTIAGIVTSSKGGGATGVMVTTDPDTGASALTAGNGAFTLEVPVGVYAVHFDNPDYEPKTISGVSIVGGGSATFTIMLERLNPLEAVGGVVEPTGFGMPAALGVTVTGAAGPITYQWEQIGGPTQVTLSSPTAAQPTFTTGTLEEILASGAVEVELEPRAGLVGIDHGQLEEMTYEFRATVSALTMTDGQWTTTATVQVKPASVQGGGFSFPTGLVAIANDAEAPSYAWTMTAPAGSSAVLQGATTRNPSFIPDVPGTFTLTNSAPDPDTVVTLRADEWLSMTTSVNCGACHHDQRDAWQGTGHATMLQRGLDGELAPYYNEECIGCHTLGYDRGADNGGFDDIAEAMSWEFPPLGPGTYAMLPDELKGFANIQCESCHGPGGDHFGSPDTMKKSLAVSACATCHQEEPYHDLVGQWRTSGHANLELALEDATTEARGTTAAHCGRCHSGQGFVRWSQQILAGNSGNITKPDGSAADLAYLQQLGLTRAEIQPQTCATCHDPHTTGLRIPEDATITLPSGYTVTELGAGTLCIACHNTRNGQRDDDHPPTSFSAPHVAAQGDVFMGKNAFFVSGYQISDHAAIQDTCATCHVTLVPDSVDTMGVNHTFKADRSICATCHGPGVTGTAISAQVELALEDVGYAAAEGVRETLASLVLGGQSYRVRAWDPATDLYSSTSSSSSNIVLAEAPTGVALVEIHGQSGFTMTMPNPVTITWTDGTSTTSSEVSFQLGSLKDMSTTPVTLFTFDSILVKGLWNYFLIHGDGSGGMHNPSFVLEVLANTRDELDLWRASVN